MQIDYRVTATEMKDEEGGVFTTYGISASISFQGEVREEYAFDDISLEESRVRELIRHLKSGSTPISHLHNEVISFIERESAPNA